MEHVASERSTVATEEQTRPSEKYTNIDTSSSSSTIRGNSQRSRLVSERNNHVDNDKEKEAPGTTRRELGMKLVNADGTTVETEHTAALNGNPDELFSSKQKHPFPLSPSYYINVIHGDLPLVLSAPHGGTEQPEWVPDLSCRRCVSDANTLQLAQQLSERIFLEHKKSPFVVLNRLHRTKMDANRDINTATEGAAFASDAYGAYHEALERCCEAARAYSPCQEALLLDIHGYAPLQNAETMETCWIMLGHLVPACVLREHADRPLAEEDWIRGPTSLGSLLEKQGLLAEPSERQTAPSERKYLCGGYITRNYRREGIRTIQLEFPRPMRDDLGHVVPKVARAVMELLDVWKLASRSDNDT